MADKNQAEAVVQAQLLALFGETPESAAEIIKENEEEKDKSADE